MGKHTVIILGAGRPSRGDDPSALVRTSGNQRVLDWIIDAFCQVVSAEFCFVGGYRFQEVIENYPDIHFSINPDWERSGSVGSLLSAPLTPGRTTYISYSDIVFDANVVRMLEGCNGDVIIAVDRSWLGRIKSRTQSELAKAEKVQIRDGHVVAMSTALAAEETDAVFAGLLKLSPVAIEALISMRESSRSELSRGGIPLLVERFLEAGLTVRSVEIGERWAELDSPRDLARFVLGTKAETLARLRPLVRRSVIGDQVSFTVDRWRTSQDEILRLVREKFDGENCIVRSSALSEDGWTSSHAGGYTSVLDVPSSDVAS